MTSAHNELEVTLEQFARMYRALAALHAERDRYNERWFAIVSEGPLEEIRRLQAQLDRLTGRAPFPIETGNLTIRVQGPGLEWPGSPLSVLSSLADAMRKGIQTIAELVLTGELASRPTRALNEACDLRLVALSPGSLVLNVELPEAAQGNLWTPEEGKAARKGIELLIVGASWAAGNEQDASLSQNIPTADIRRAVLTQLKRLVPRPRGKVADVELSGSLTQHRKIHLTRETTRRLDAAIDAIASSTVETYEGDLREIDLDKRTLVLREIEAGPYEVHCEYIPELDSTALDALNKRVSVTGTRPLDRARKRQPLKVHRLTILDREDME